MRTLVTGGRDYSDRGALDLLHAHYPITAMLGVLTAYAVIGLLAVEFHMRRTRLTGKATVRLPVLYVTVAHPQYCVAFPGGRGTADMMRKATVHGLTVWVPC